jgi:two-component system sensor histidine kinase CreC
MRIGLRILLGTFAIVALTGLLLTQVFVAQVKPGVRQAMEDTLVDTANVLAELASDDVLAGRIADGRFAARVSAMQARDPGAAIWGFAKRETNYRIYVTDARGIVVFDSAGRDIGADYSRWNDVRRTLRGEYGARSTAEDPANPESTVMHVAAPITDYTGEVVGVLTVAKPNRVMAPFIERSQDTILGWGIGLLGVALLIGAITSAWIGRQLGALRDYAQAVTAGERATLPRSAGEFAALGAALETMRLRLEDRQYVERYVEALTHELKSPLAAIHASAELLEQPLPEADQARFAAAIRSQSERLTRMVERLLALTALEHRQRLEDASAIDVAGLLADVAEDARLRCESRGQRIDLQVGSDARVTGDPFLLRQALANLVDNASDFAPLGGVIELDSHIVDGGVAIEVRDRGPGIPDFARDRVFERFYSLPRPDGAHRSSGLGLSFVAEVANLHAGSATLENRADGGAVARMTLPRAMRPV